MSMCTCEDADDRLMDLKKSPYLDSQWIENVQMARAANRDKIKEAREQLNKNIPRP
jgi:hypothetical protein